MSKLLNKIVKLTMKKNHTTGGETKRESDLPEPTFTEFPVVDENSHEMIQKKIAELSKSGYHLLKDEQLDDAIYCFLKILDLDPDNSYALVGIGDAKRKKGDFQEASRYYNMCLQLQDNNYALFGLADCYKASRSFSKAIEIWERYLRQDDKNITVLTRVADAYRKIKDFSSSKKYYIQVLEFEANNPYALIGLGHLHYDFREYQAALGYWERILDSNSKKVDIRVLTSLGNCHRKLKTYELGLKYFEMALELDSNNFYALFGLADCYRGITDHEASLKYWKKIIKIDQKNKVILTRIGDAYRNMGDLDKAEESYNGALDIDFDIYAVLGLVSVAYARGNYEEAIVSLTDLIKKDPKNHRLYVEIARCYVALGETSRAIEILNNFLKSGVKSYMVNNLLSELQQ